MIDSDDDDTMDVDGNPSKSSKGMIDMGVEL